MLSCHNLTLVTSITTYQWTNTCRYFKNPNNSSLQYVNKPALWPVTSFSSHYLPHLSLSTGQTGHKVKLQMYSFMFVVEIYQQLSNLCVMEAQWREGDWDVTSRAAMLWRHQRLPPKCPAGPRLSISPIIYICLCSFISSHKNLLTVSNDSGLCFACVPCLSWVKCGDL